MIKKGLKDECNRVLEHSHPFLAHPLIVPLFPDPSSMPMPPTKNIANNPGKLNPVTQLLNVYVWP